MHKRLLVGLVVGSAIFSPQLLWADCASDEREMFKCTFSKGKKQVELCAGETNATYTFGKIGKSPDMHISQPLSSVYLPWNGIGRTIWEQMNFTNADVTYSVSFGVDRMDENAKPYYGLIVSQGDKQLAELVCDEGSEQMNFDVAYDALTKQGYCYSLDTQEWSKSACQ